MNFDISMVGGFPTAVLTRSELADLMVAQCLAARITHEPSTPRLVFSSNGQGIALAGKSATFNAAMQAADVIHADGMSVVLASRLTRNRLPERIATTDFFHDAAIAAVRSGVRFYFLGATEAQNKKAVAKVRQLYPSLQIVGHRSGFFSAEEEESVCREIVDSGAEVLWVALGKPRQELWSVQNRESLRGVTWIKTCGGLYAFLAGDAPRAPKWMQNIGLEWLYRAAREPSRLGLRYLTTNPYAVYRLFRHTKQVRQ